MKNLKTFEEFDFKFNTSDLPARDEEDMHDDIIDHEDGYDYNHVDGEFEEGFDSQWKKLEDYDVDLYDNDMDHDMDFDYSDADYLDVDMTPETSYEPSMESRRNTIRKSIRQRRK